MQRLEIATQSFSNLASQVSLAGVCSVLACFWACRPGTLPSLRLARCQRPTKVMIAWNAEDFRSQG
jgi:hypothetical protein